MAVGTLPPDFFPLMVRPFPLLALPLKNKLFAASLRVYRIPNHCPPVVEEGRGNCRQENLIIPRAKLVANFDIAFDFKLNLKLLDTVGEENDKKMLKVLLLMGFFIHAYAYIIKDILLSVHHTVLRHSKLGSISKMV